VSFQAQRSAVVFGYEVDGPWSPWQSFTARSRSDGTIQSYWGTCIDVPFGNTAPGTLLQNYQCVARARSQQWAYDSLGRLVDWSGNVMDVYGYSRLNGARVDTFFPNGQLNQVWNLTNAEILGLGDKCLDDRAWGGAGTLLQIWTCNGGSNQHWNFSSGTISGYQGLCVEADVNNRTDIRMANCRTTDAQKWFIDAGGMIRNKATNRCMNLPNWDFGDGTPVQQGDCVPASTGEKWAWRGNITSPIDGACLDLQGGGWANGTPIQMWQCLNDDDNQQWTFAP
jgi:hypothetical protein